MTEVRVAVVDSGIHPGHPHVPEITEAIAFDAEGAQAGSPVDRLGHGTAVAAAIHDLSPTASLLVAKVFDTKLETSVRALVAGIDWAAERGAALINLSLGVKDSAHRDALQGAVSRAARLGAILVAVGEHDGIAWLPGMLDGVLRVELDWSHPRGRFACRRRDGSPIFETCGYPRPIPGVDPVRNLKGVSFAVANMTGVAARVMAATGRIDFETLVSALERQAIEPQ